MAVQLIAKDTSIPINVISQDEAGTPYSLQNATAVNLIWIYPDGITRKSAAMTVQSTTLRDDASNTLAGPYFWAQYLPNALDFTIDGNYSGQMQTTFAVGGSPSSIPFTIVVGKKL